MEVLYKWIDFLLRDYFGLNIIYLEYVQFICTLDHDVFTCIFFHLQNGYFNKGFEGSLDSIKIQVMEQLKKYLQSIIQHNF